jgi:hypothetical protein
MLRVHSFMNLLKKLHIFIVKISENIFFIAKVDFEKQTNYLVPKC